MRRLQASQRLLQASQLYIKLPPTNCGLLPPSARSFLAPATPLPALHRSPQLPFAARGYSRSSSSPLASPDAALYALMGLNVAGFVAWRTQPPSWCWRHLAVWPAQALEPTKWYTLLTSAFSHKDGWHLGSNLMGLYFFGRDIGRLFGGQRLIALYCAGGVAGSLAHTLMMRYEWREKHPSLAKIWGYPTLPPAIGASGAVNACIVLSAALFPNASIYIIPIPFPIPAFVVAALALMRDVYRATGAGDDGVAHAGHLGGAAMGAAAYALLRLKARR